MVSAPYNFVPLSDRICATGDLAPGLKASPSQDIPQDGGALAGTISLELSCDTPLLIGSGAPGGKCFLAEPVGGKPVIPGSSLRGMIRNVLEIATFARMSLVDDQRVGVRDLDALLDYRDRMSDIRAGWLRVAEEDNKAVLKLTSCKMTQILHTELDSVSEGFSGRITDLAKLSDAKKRGAEQVEKAFTGRCKSLTIGFDGQGDEIRLVNGGEGGTLVCTGLPGTKTVADPDTGKKYKISSKRREFVFYGSGDDYEVSSSIWVRFLAVHEGLEKESETWKWRKKAFYAGKPIPVFWLPGADGQPHQIGLAMMFKLAADNSIHEMIGHSCKDHLEDTILDLPTRIFGRAAKEERDQDSKARTEGFRTRVSFGWARIEGDYERLEFRDVVSAKPKPSYVPSYVRQRDFSDPSGTRLLTWQEQNTDRNGRRQERTVGAQYRSYMNWPAHRPVKEQIRGWKRYPAQPPRPAEDLPKGEGDSAATLRPIRGKNGPLKFTGHIRYHNLHPVELGALVWALGWGGNGTLRHALGMGRPFGWGQVALHFTQTSELQKAQSAFEEAMEAWARQNHIPGGWRGSVQIRQLLVMADPQIGARHTDGMLRQMKLDPKGENEFFEARKARCVLPEYYPDAEAPSLVPGKKTMAKGYNPARPAGKGKRWPAPPKRPTTTERVGGNAFYAGEIVKILTIEGDQVTVAFDDGEQTTVNRKDLKF